MAIADVCIVGVGGTGGIAAYVLAQAGLKVADIVASVDGKAVVGRVRLEQNVIVAGGEGPVEGKIVRIGHLGWVHLPEIKDVLAALETVLSKQR